MGSAFGSSHRAGRSKLLRFSLKTRLTLLYGALFTLSGTALLAINYLLVRATIPASAGRGPVVAGPPSGSAPSPSGSIRLEVDAIEPARPPPAGNVQIGIEEYRSSVLSTLLIQSVVAVAVTAALALVLGWVVARRALRPVHEITATARRLSADSLVERRLAMTGPHDELTELADTFDGMLDRLAVSFDSQRRFVANASHELRTPLAVQRTLIEVAMSQPDGGQVVHQLGERLLAMNRRSEQLIEGLLVLARSDRGLPAVQDVRLDQVVEQVLEQQQAEAETVQVSMHAELAPVKVAGDRVLLERLVTNLVQNAVRHNVADGEVWVRVGGPSALEISNTGPLVPAPKVPELFEPFRRLAGDRTRSERGVGLGLSIVSSVVKAHGGAVQATPRPGGGLTVTVELPAPQSDEPATAAAIATM